MGILFRILLLFYISTNFCTFGEVHDDGHDIIWCRHCGASVGHASYMFNKLSPGNVKVDYQIVFGKNVTVQRLINPFLFMFDVVTTTKAACVDHGRNSRGDSWFPGYSWRICTCPGCASQIGWTFERTLSNDVMDTNENETFHALILDTLYDKESTVDNLGMTTPLHDLNTTRAPLMPRVSGSSSSASISSSSSVQPFQPRASDDQSTSLAIIASTKKDISTTTITTTTENKLITTAANTTATTKTAV